VTVFLAEQGLLVTVSSCSPDDFMSHENTESFSCQKAGNL